MESNNSPPPKKFRFSANRNDDESNHDGRDFEENITEEYDEKFINKYIKEVYEGQDVEFNEKFKFQKWRATFVVEDLPSTNPENLLRQLFQNCIDNALKEARKNGTEPDNLGLTIGSRLLSYDIWIPIRPINKGIADSALNRFQLVAQSKTNEGNLFGEPFTITITTVDKKRLSASAAEQRQLEGSGNNNKKQCVPQAQYRISRKSLIPVNNFSDSYCLFHALYLTYIHKMGILTKQKFYNLVHRDHERRQRAVEDLMERAKIPFGLPSYQAKSYVPKIVKLWNDEGRGRQLSFKVFIFEAFEEESKPSYTHGLKNFNIPIVLYFDENHFWGVRSLAGLFEKDNYCLGCLSTYGTAKRHKKDCTKLCLNCGEIGTGCCLFNQNGIDFEHACSGCNKKFFDKYFFKNISIKIG